MPSYICIILSVVVCKFNIIILRGVLFLAQIMESTHPLQFWNLAIAILTLLQKNSQ